MTDTEVALVLPEAESWGCWNRMGQRRDHADRSQQLCNGSDGVPVHGIRLLCSGRVGRAVLLNTAMRSRVRFWLFFQDVFDEPLKFGDMLR